MSRFLENVFSQYDHIVHSGHPHSQGMSTDPGQGMHNQAPDVQAPDDPPWHTRDDLADRMEAADKRLNEHMKNPQGATFKQDEDGMGKAYADTTAKGVYYDPASTTEYIKGSTTKQDWFDDATKIPFWGDTRDSERYQEAEKAYEDLGAQGHPIHRVVGHSALAGRIGRTADAAGPRSHLLQDVRGSCAGCEPLR